MKLSPTRFYWLYFHSIILKNTFGRRKIVRTLVMTISTAGHRTLYMYMQCVQFFSDMFWMSVFMYFLVVLLHVCTFLFLFLVENYFLSGLIDSVKWVTQSLSTQSPSKWQSIDSVTNQLTWILNPIDSVNFGKKWIDSKLSTQSNRIVYKSALVIHIFL